MIFAPGFHYINGTLQCDGVPASEIAERFGTPCYVYSAGLLRDRYRRIHNAFALWNALVCFSVKSLSNLAVLRLLAEQGSGFDIVSGGELYRVLQAGGDPAKTVYAGVGKTAGEIEYALRAGVSMFNAESSGELSEVNRVASRLGKRACVAIRVNPDVDPNTHEKTTTGTKENKFGIGITESLAIGAKATTYESVEVRGLHMHLGSPIYSPEPYERGLEKLALLAGRMRELGCQIDTFNIGGGFPISYTGEKVSEPDHFAAALKDILEKLRCAVIIEPGRYIAGPSGLLLTRVVYRKRSEHGKRFLVCDAGMNDLMRPTLYGAFHRIWPVKSQGGMPPLMTPKDTVYEGVEAETVDVVGPVCESGDFFAKSRPLPPVQEGEILAAFDVGAYGFTMSSNYNARPRAAEVKVDSGRASLVRRRETYEDLVSAERTEQ